MINFEKIWDSFCDGIISIIVMWLMGILVVLLFSIGQDETFTIVGWLIVTIVAIVCVIVKLSTSTTSTNKQSDKQYVNDVKLRRFEEIVSAFEHRYISNTNIENACAFIRDNIEWIRANNSIYNSDQIDNRLDEINHRLRLLTI